MELRHLRYFVAVAEERSFTRAARLLRVAQPSLSQQVRELERELGAVLIDRSVRPAALTPAGARLLDEARAVLHRLDHAVGAVGRAARGETGELRLGYPTGGLYATVLEVARAFRRERPDAGLVLLQVPGEDQFRAVREGRADIVLGRIGRGAADTDGVRVARLRTESLLAVLPADHRLAGGTAVVLADLADEPFVLFPARGEPLIAGRYLAACEAAGFTPRIALEPVDAQSQALAVAAGLGVALTGDGIAVRFPDLAYLPVTPPTPVADIAALWPAVDPAPLLAPVLAALGLGRAEGAGGGSPLSGPRR